MARTFQRRDPRTKGEVVDRLLSFDFQGDLRDIGGAHATIERTGPQSFLLRFPETGRAYEFVVRLPRDEQGLPARSVTRRDTAPAMEARTFQPEPPEKPPKKRPYKRRVHAT